MSGFTSDFMRILDERGFIHQCSDPQGLDALAKRGEVVGYIGFDCTAPSLHVGSLVQIMMLHWLQLSGNRAIALMGGGTTRVGDPSGRDESRKLLSIEDIDANKTSIAAVFSRFLDFTAPNRAALMPDNAEWLTRMNYIDMLRDVGRHFSINRMLSMDSVKLRLDREQELSFIEFNYMILQSYDFVELARRYGTNLQLGGSDQWGNIVNGIDLGRRMGTHQLFALTTPLITTASGAKMGKTAAGAVWLNADMLSPYDYWQFWRNATTAMWTAFCDCSRRSRLTRWRDWRGSRALSLTTPKNALRPRQPLCCMAATQPNRLRQRQNRPSKWVRRPQVCQLIPSTAVNWQAASVCLPFVRAGSRHQTVKPAEPSRMVRLW